MNLPQNLFDGNVSVQTFLCQPNKEIIGEIMPYDFDASFKFNSYSEISFSIDRFYNDLIDGTTKINPYYEFIESLRVIYIRGVGHFIIQDVDEDVSENESKSVSCFSLEYNTGQKYLENFYVNTGEEGSIETMYHAQQYGAEYSIDDYYTLASGDFDAYQRYYIKEYSNANNTTSYNYVETPVLDAKDYNSYDFDLYVKKYPNVRFYWPTKPELSLLHHVFDRIPEWKIGHVDKELWYQERTFSEDRTAVYDFLYNTAAETLDFVMVWDSINGTCSFYKATEDGMTTDNYVRTNTYSPGFVYYSDDKGTVADPQPLDEKSVVEGFYYINIGKDIDTQWNTDVFISRENLASSLDIKYSTDDIKTKLKITGSDNLDIRDVNLGQNYILNLDYYMPKNKPSKWVSYYLWDKYNKYTEKLKSNTDQYKKLISTWSAAYNEYSDLMNYVPAEPRVMLIGDQFEKLYCVKNQYLPASKTFDKSLTYFRYDTDKNSTTYLTYVPAIPPPQNDEDLENGQYYVLSKSTLSELVKQLQTKLSTYKVDQREGEPSEIARTEDVLLTLENDKSDSATIRVGYSDDKKTYCVYRTRTDATTGVSNTISFTLEEWVSGALKADYESIDGKRKMNLSGFRIKSIGTLGAYFCLVRDEIEKANLEDYGIRLLQEKQEIYTKIFITQTEGYMSKEGAQCVTSNEEPKGDEYPVGTKWLDTNNTDKDGKLIMKERRYTDSTETTAEWIVYTPDDKDYEDYARFYENYIKLGNVQAVLAEKQRTADYLLNGIPISVMQLTGDNIKLENLLRVAIMHFIVLDNDYYIVKLGEALPNGDISEGAVLFIINEKTYEVSIQKYNTADKRWDNHSLDTKITLEDYDPRFGCITFTVDSDKNKYAAYVINGTPYVSYAHSQGLCLAKMNIIKNETDMNNPDNFSKEDLISLSPFIREDEFSDSNFLLTGYESEEEQMNIKQELLKAGDEELKKICQPKLSFSASMANILAIPEFAPLRKQFKLGNFVRIGIREDYIKRARLLEVQINFDDPSDFSATFGDLISTRSEVDKHAELLQQAVTAGKSVASNASKWQRGADKATELDNAINDGLKNAALSVGAADGQAIVWDKYGIRGRKLKEGSTDEYEPQQFALLNNKLVFTDDNWETSRAVVGEFEIELPDSNNNNVMVKQNMYGLLADAIVGGYIQGTEIVGGELRIGGSGGMFIVKKDGSVEIKSGDGSELYAQTSAVTAIDSAYKYSIQIVHTGQAVFSTKKDTATMTAKIYRRGEDATENFKNAGVEVNWEKNPSETNWSPTYAESDDSYSITLKSDDVQNSAQISCYIDPTEKQIAEIEKNYND